MTAGKATGTARQTSGDSRRGRATAIRERGLAVRRPRRGDQHHPPPAAGARRGSRASRPQPQRRGHRPRGDPGGRGRHRRELVPGRAQRVLPLHGRHAARARRRAHPDRGRRGRHDRPARDRGAARVRGRADLFAGGRSQARPRRHDRRRARACARVVAPGFRFGPVGPRDHQQIARTISALEAEDDASGLRETLRKAVAQDRAPGPGDRHHGHGWRGQVEPHRRAADALRAAFPRPQHRGRRHGPDATPQRRCAARRPHPHELARGRAGVHALACDATPEPRDQRGPRRRAEPAALCRLRPGRGRDRRHRPERLGDRRSRRRAAVRDDERVRCREPAREDRHARLRGADRAEQVREAGRRGCAARRPQAVAPESRGVPAAG